MTGATAVVKHKTKSHFLSVFQKAGKKMAGFHGDVAVDGARKQVGTQLWLMAWTDVVSRLGRRSISWFIGETRRTTEVSNVSIFFWT